MNIAPSDKSHLQQHSAHDCCRGIYCISRLSKIWAKQEPSSAQVTAKISTEKTDENMTVKSWDEKQIIHCQGVQ